MITQEQEQDKAMKGYQASLKEQFSEAKREALAKEKELDKAKRELIRARAKCGEVLAELRSIKAKPSPTNKVKAVMPVVNVSMARRGSFKPERVESMFNILLKLPFRKALW